MNQVDCSPETVEKEWDKLALEFNVDLSEISEKNESGENVVPDKLELSNDEKERLTSDAIVGVVKTYAGFLMGLEIEEEVYRKFGDAWAVIVVQKWPDNPVAEMYKNWEHYILAAWSSYTLIVSISSAKREKLAKENEPKKKEKGSDVIDHDFEEMKVGGSA